MDGNDIIVLLTSNIPTVMSTVVAIAGSLFTAIFLRNNTATKEFEKVKAGQLKEVADELLKSGKMSYSEYYKSNNFLTVVKKADEYYAQSARETVDEQYDFDWFVRFYEAVGNISNDRMQEIWAQILSGEISRPGSFSLRTIEILKNIGQKDAELFEKICSYAINFGNHIFVPYYESYLNESGITYSEIMRLDELGLMNSNGMLVLKVSVPNKRSILFHNNRLVITAKSTGENEVILDVHQFPLTDVGRELSRIQTINAPDCCLTTLARKLSKNREANVEFHNVIKIDGNDIQYENRNLLENDYIAREQWE